MRLGRWVFGVFYRVGYTPWHEHALPDRFTELAAELPKGRALDLGCGTGEASIQLAQRGWDVTGVDFVDKALKRAARRSREAGVNVNFVRADVRKLERAGIVDRFDLMVDFCCLHGFPDSDRDRYARAVTRLASPGATFFLLGFARSMRRGPTGFDVEEVSKRFGPEGWDVVGHERSPDSANLDYPDADPAWYELRKR